MAQNNEKATIVLVDDEEMVLTSLKSFLNLETDYEIKSFETPAAALRYIEENNVDLVVSDYLMPEMNGISFLGEVRKLKPDVPRIILTGYADKENAIKAINEVGLFQYIEKPWDNDDLLIILRNGLERSLLLKKLQEKIEQINHAYDELDGMHKQILKTFI